MTKGGLQKQKLKRQARDDIIEDDVTNEADAAAGSANTLVANEEKAVSKLPKKELSKRQRRKLPNDKHKWPQHPKIQSMEARHKAYIRTAGLGSVLANDSKDDDDGNSNKKKRKGKSNDKKKVKKSAISDFIDPSLDIMSPEVKFGRVLGGADQRSRHAAVLKLKQYLRARCDINNDHGGLSEMDLLKLFKGLWFTLYMCDKVPVQDELSKKLASLIWCVAGTEEEDEYAGQAYLDLCSYNEGDIGGDDDEFDGGDIAEDESSEELVGDDDSSSDDDEEEIAMHEIYNSLAIQGSDDEAEPEDDSVEGESNEEDSSELEEDEAETNVIEEQDEVGILFTQGGEVSVSGIGVKERSVEVFERTFTVTHALNVLTLSVAGFAIFTSLLTQSAMRLPQLAPVWALGLTRRKLAGLELLRGILLAGLTMVMALPLGLVLAWLLLAVVNVEAFGWRLPMHVFAWDWLVLGFYGLIATALAATIPARRFSQTDPAELVKVFAHER